MKATGIVRRIDDLGRVVIPKEIRRTMRIRKATRFGTCCYIPHKTNQHKGLFSVIMNPDHKTTAVGIFCIHFFNLSTYLRRRCAWVCSSIRKTREKETGRDRTKIGCLCC